MSCDQQLGLILPTDAYYSSLVVDREKVCDLTANEITAGEIRTDTLIAQNGFISNLTVGTLTLTLNVLDIAPLVSVIIPLYTPGSWNTGTVTLTFIYPKVPTGRADIFDVRIMNPLVHKVPDVQVA